MKTRAWPGRPHLFLFCRHMNCHYYFDYRMRSFRVLVVTFHEYGPPAGFKEGWETRHHHDLRHPRKNDEAGHRPRQPRKLSTPIVIISTQVQLKAKCTQGFFYCFSMTKTVQWREAKLPKQPEIFHERQESQIPLSIQR